MNRWQHGENAILTNCSLRQIKKLKLCQRICLAVIAVHIPINAMSQASAVPGQPFSNAASQQVQGGGQHALGTCAACGLAQYVHRLAQPASKARHPRCQLNFTSSRLQPSLAATSRRCGALEPFSCPLASHLELRKCSYSRSGASWTLSSRGFSCATR